MDLINGASASRFSEVPEDASRVSYTVSDAALRHRQERYLRKLDVQLGRGECRPGFTYHLVEPICKESSSAPPDLCALLEACPMCPELVSVVR